MKITYKEYHPIASWRWDVNLDQDKSAEAPQPETHDGKDDEGLVGDDAASDESDDDDDDEDDEEMCGVCQQEFESACPACGVPGDDCPLSTSPFLASPGLSSDSPFQSKGHV